MKSDLLYVIAPIINPVRYRSRYSLYQNFEKMVTDAGAKLITIEVAFGERPFQITNGAANHIQLRTKFELWHKECMLNLAIARLPFEAKYIAWVDADVQFARPDWAAETVHQLQHYHVVQMFSHAQDLGPDFQVIGNHEAFAYNWVTGIKAPRIVNNTLGFYPYYGLNYYHPGFAWAARRSALDKLGGLLDTAILGAGDHHMAWALVGQAQRTYPKGLSKGYTSEIIRWQDRALKHLHRNVGFVPGTLSHYWHGKKRDRKYKDRWQILVKHGYDPATDIKRDAQGLWQLTDRNWRMRDDIRGYFRARNEDSIDL